MNTVDLWILFDNSNYKSERIAFGGRNVRTKVNDTVKFEIIRKYE